jgi:hypothetical protein
LFISILSTDVEQKTSVTLEEIDSVEDFVGKLERIEPPGQMISFLTDPLLQKYLALKPSSITSRRIELWLSASLEEEYNAARSGLEDSSYLFEIADGLGKQSQYHKVSRDCSQKFDFVVTPVGTVAYCVYISPRVSPGVGWQHCRRRSAHTPRVSSLAAIPRYERL